MSDLKKKFSIVWIFIAALLGSAIVGVTVAWLSIGSDNPAVPVPVITSAPEAGMELPLAESDLNGRWFAENNGTTLEATVDVNTITIVMINDGATMVYWYGSFDATASSGDSVLSEKIGTDELVLSTADDKDFVIGDNTMSFEMKAMGMTKTVEMTRG